MATHIVFLVHGMGRQVDDPHSPATAWHKPVIDALDKAWLSFDALKGKQRGEFVEFVPITYDQVFQSYLKGVSSGAEAIAKRVPNAKAKDFFEALGDAGADPNFFWDDVVDVLLYRYGADLYRNLHLAIETKIVETVQSYWDRQGALGCKFSMISHSLGTAIAHGALNRLGGGNVANSAAFKLGGPFSLTSYMSLANVSRLLWWGEHELYASTILRPPARGVRGYTECFFNVHNAVDPIPMPRAFAPTSWGPAFVDVPVQHLHQLDVHCYEHYLSHPRVTGLFYQSLLGDDVLPDASIDRACASPRFDEITLVGAPKRQAMASLRDQLAQEMRQAFAGDAGLLPSVASLLGRATRLIWRARREITQVLV